MRASPVCRSRRCLARAALLLVAMTGACQEPPTTIAPRCVAAWPESRTAAPPAAPLEGVEPRILWRTPITRAGARDWLLVTDERVALVAGRRLYILGHDGNVVGGRTPTARESISSAVADEQGNFYFVGQNAYSTDRDGALRWLVPLAGIRSDAPNAGHAIALAPDGTFYVGATDGALYALSTADGSQRWRQPVVLAGEGSPVVIGGIGGEVGGAVVAITRGEPGRYQLFDANTGKPLANWLTPEGERFGAMFGPSLGIVTQRMEDRGGPYPWMHISALDSCSRERFRIPATRPQWPVLVGPGDQLYVVERDDVEGSQTFVSIYAPDGERALGPIAAAPPWALGADGTVYGLECDSPGHDGPSRLLAYNSALDEQWRLELGASCPHAGPVIHTDGRLYFAWHIDGVTEVVAVQTRSPGLADASWPTRRRDARGTAWVR